MKIPHHIAFIMDGNGRWATRRGMARSSGHRAGAQAFARVVQHCDKLGVQVVTVYAFSTENWRRPPEEINAILTLLGEFLEETFANSDKADVEIHFLGDMLPFEAELREKLTRLENITRGRSKRLNIALNYGARAELTRAVNTLLANNVTSVTEEDISSRLYTAGRPDPDLIVRTAGELRLSNFLLWQAAYSEFYVMPTLWPNIRPRHVNRAIRAYGRRKRRYGGL